MKLKWVAPLIVLAFILAACSTSEVADAGDGIVPETEAPSANEPPGPQPGTGVENLPLPDDDVDEDLPSGVEREFNTDFSKHSVPYSEIFSGGPPKDGIPSIDNPGFVSVDEADEWLADVEPVIFVQVGEDARAYPIQILIWHEIVNDTVGGLPLTITFCPLCNTAIVFERVVGGQELDFGTTGRLRISNLIMYDRQTESWWQQATGEAIVGDYLGTTLTFYPGSIIAWEDFASTFPDGRVLSKDTGFERSYGRNPYFGYDDINSSPFLYRGETPGVLAAMERILALEIGEETVAYAYSILSELGVIHDQVGGEEVVVFWAPGTASPLDSGIIPDGRDVGSAVAFSPVVEGEALKFTPTAEGAFRDERTGSTWNIFGQAVSGPLQGENLTPLTAVNHFWFDWVAFKPETRVYEAP